MLDMSEIDEKQMLLYAQMANLVNLILQFPSVDLREIAENFSKVGDVVPGFFVFVFIGMLFRDNYLSHFHFY